MDARLILQCGGAYDSTNPTGCKKTVNVRLYSNLNKLSKALQVAGWTLAATTSVGVTPVVFSSMCLPCARIIMPEAAKAYDKARGV